ncbi:NYN domain-containing protein [bacterium]|nr:NYN domain-containing protein [bacterium]
MTRDHENLIALFIDYDNIAIGLKESGGKPFEVRRVLERLLEKGRIIYKRAYADWYLFSDAKQPLHEHAIEMIDIPMRRNIGKNSADIRMVVDALDLCYTKEHIDTFVIGSGDSDFTPLVSKLKENDKRVIGFGLTQSTSNLLANNCDEFIFYEDLVSLAVNRPQLPMGLTKRQADAFNMILDAVAALMRENKDALWGSLIKDTIRRKRPSFTEGQYGYSSFSQLLEDAAKHQLIGLIKDPKSGGTPVVTGFGLASDADAAAKLSSGAQAAPAPIKTPSLQVKPDSTRLLSTDNGTEEKKPTRTRTRRRPSTRKTAAEKAAEKAAKEAAETESAEKKDTAREEPKAGEKDEKTETKAELVKLDKAEAEKKPVRRTTRRRSTAKPKTADKKADEAKADEAKADEPKAEETTAKADDSVEKKAPARKPRTRSKAKPAKETKAAAEASSSESGTESKKQTKVEPAPVSSGSEQDKQIPKGEPLRTRVRRRRR